MIEPDSKTSKSVCWCIVDGKWVVSMIYRQSSACVNSPPWYYEIMVWEYTKERTLGHWYGNVGEWSGPKSAMNQFRDICLGLVEGKTPEEVME